MIFIFLNIKLIDIFGQRTFFTLKHRNLFWKWG